MAVLPAVFSRGEVGTCAVSEHAIPSSVGLYMLLYMVNLLG